MCKEQIDLDVNKHEEGDFIQCTECTELLELELRNGKFKLVTDQEKKVEEIEPLDPEFDFEEE